MALFQTYTNVTKGCVIGVLGYEIQYTHPLCYALFALKPGASFTPRTDLPSLIFCLTPFGWLHFFNASPIVSDGNIHFLFTPTFSGTQLGRKTRAVCVSVHYVMYLYDT